jgi:hypothetical protein
MMKRQRHRVGDATLRKRDGKQDQHNYREARAAVAQERLHCSREHQA